MSPVVGQAAPQSQDKPRKIVSDDFTKSRKEDAGHVGKARTVRPHRTYRLASGAGGPARSSVSANLKLLGITIWKLRESRRGDSDRRALIREKNNARTWAAERVESDSTFREGDYVRLSVESPNGGYLYVIDRDLLADGKTGDAMLIFPWSGADNKLAAGRLIDIPAQEDDPNHFTARLSGPDQIGELLTFIVTASPLDLPISDKPLRLDARQLVDWEKSWSATVERYEMEGGAGELWTRAEQQAAAKHTTRQLTRNDPPPQTIYRIFGANKQAILVSVPLKYGK